VEEKPSFPNEFQKRTLWKAVTGLALLTIGTLLVGLIWLTSSVLGYLQPVFVPLAVAGIVAYLLHPIVQWLQAKRFSRVQGIITVFVGFLLFFGVLFYFVGNKLSEQVKDLLAEDGGTSSYYMEASTLESAKQNGFYGWIMRSSFRKDAQAVRAYLDNGGSLVGPNKIKWRIDPDTGNLTDGINPPSDEIENLLESDWSNEIPIEGVEHPAALVALYNWDLTKGGQWFSGLGRSALHWLSNSSGKILGFFGIILGFAMVPIYLYYFLKESEGIKKGWTDYIPLKASSFKDEVVSTLQEINGYLISFFRGQVLVAFIDGILVGITLTIFQLPYGLLIGVFMAFLGIIPYIGNIICLIPACFIAYFHGFKEPYGIPQWGYVFGVLAIFVIVQQINSLLTAPKIVGDSVGLHPMTVIFSMLFWSLLLGGFLGALLAVPLTAAVKVLFRRYVWERQMQEA
jgi:predicted PurR-regulated permease PerM